jgi:hypothetical protein
VATRRQPSNSPLGRPSVIERIDQKLITVIVAAPDFENATF